MKPGIKDSRILMYLGIDNSIKEYHNTLEENTLVQLWNSKYLIAKAEYEASYANSRNVTKWRNAYKGDFNQLDEFGNETELKMKALHKMAFELVESKVNPHIPAVKMTPRHYSDIVPVNSTEALIMQEMDKMLSEEVHDESEHATLIDSTCWFKVSWNPFDNTHERSGMPVVECCTVDTVFPQPGITNYKQLEYIFHTFNMTMAQIIDLYNRGVKSDTDKVKVVECYYLNEDRYVGKFAWVEDDLTVLCNDLEWGMRRRRECMDCGHIEPVAEKCGVCHSTNLKYVGVKKHRLLTPLELVVNPYRSGETANREQDFNDLKNSHQIPAGTEIPFYLIRQLPFVPKRLIKVPGDMYGISEVQQVLESQDAANKFLNKAERKSGQSKTWITKLKDTRVDDEDREVAYVEVESAQEAAAIQVKQITADINEELIMAKSLYDISKGVAGITDTDQGRTDPSARSGKAKQIQLAASQSRQQSPQVQRNVAYTGVYELIFKNLLAYCDEERSFVNTLPDGSFRDETWSKYMFLDRDENGNFYYRDDFAWSVDNASDITQDRASMWQLIDNDYMNGVMGNTIDPVRALHMYWHMKARFGYPTAKFAIAFLEEAHTHLPTQIEQALVNNPDAVKLAMSYIADMQGGGGAGGARDGSGRPSSQQTKGQQQGRANNESRAAQGQMTTTNAMKTGGMQGGTE